jgi:hypothetical protein
MVYAVYLAIILVVSYYSWFLYSKPEYTRQELTNIKPMVETLRKRLSTRYGAGYVFIIMLIFSTLGMLFAHIPHWFFQSALLTIVIFLLFPVIQKRFQDQMVITSAEFSDTAANIFSRYCDIIFLGYGSGFGAGYMYYWNGNRDVFFLWFALNMVIVTALLIAATRKIFK